MARRREFDTDLAVERAKELFWSNGFHATSMGDLSAGLRLGPGSIYAAFGSKEGLFEQAMDRYCDEQTGQMLSALEGEDDPRAVLRGILIGLAEMDLETPRGCLLVNSVAERDEHTETVERVSKVFRQVESAIAGALERAIALGRLDSRKDPVALANFFTTFIQGVRVMGQARAGRAVMESAIESALTTLD